MHVDHFVPWALYPSNLGHNFVLADAGCNADKSSLLADESHHQHWRRRNEDVGAQMHLGFEAHGIVADVKASHGIADWAYERARATNAVFWVARNNVRANPAV